MFTVLPRATSRHSRDADFWGPKRLDISLIFGVNPLTFVLD